MNSAQPDIAAELFEECGFWLKFTGGVRKPADGWLGRMYWLGRIVARGLILALLPARTAPPHAAQARCEVLMIYVTENQRRALLPWIGTQPGFQTASQLPGADWPISWARCGRLMLRYTASVYRLLSRRPDHALSIPWLEDFVRYRAALVLARELYDRTDPRIVVVSNDHSGFFRAFIRVARDRGCRLVYTQHGSIGRNFPRLDFDLALLDGMQAYLHYSESGPPRGTILITGRHRPEVIARPPATDEEAIAVGLATNWDEPLTEWAPLLRLIAHQFSKVTLRCHPAETRRLAWRFLCWRNGIALDAGTLRDFLAQQSVLISGMSGIVLDAALSGVPSIVKISPTLKSPALVDYFGYRRFGLSTISADIHELPALVRACARKRIDPDQIGAYDAGLVQDPTMAKRVALEIFAQCVRDGRDLSSALAERYLSTRLEGHSLLMSAEYAAMTRKQGWLPELMPAMSYVHS